MGVFNLFEPNTADPEEALFKDLVNIVLADTSNKYKVFVLFSLTENLCYETNLNFPF